MEPEISDRIEPWQQMGLDGSPRGVVTGNDAGSTPGDGERKGGGVGDKPRPDETDSRNPCVLLRKWKCKW